MLSYPLIIGVSLIGVLSFSVIIYGITGDIVSVFVIFALAAILGYVLHQYGYLTISTDNTGLDIKFFEVAPTPTATTKIVPDSSKNAIDLHQKEVFYISGNNYTYDDAPAVCAAYGADLASYDQLMEAYSSGAEWCGYGWSKGGMALFPTQDSTWSLLQGEADTTKRTGCGRPGVNGGYFDPATKFGVNCYGIKPGNKGTKFPLPIPGSDPNEFNKSVDKFKSMINKMVVSPFNRVGWSEWNVSSHK
jgi:hypothetical protein